MFYIFYPMASATAYGQGPKFFMVEHSATAEGENCAYGPKLLSKVKLSSLNHSAQVARTISDFFFYKKPSLLLKSKNKFPDGKTWSNC